MIRRDDLDYVACAQCAQPLEGQSLADAKQCAVCDELICPDCLQESKTRNPVCPNCLKSKYQTIDDLLDEIHDLRETLNCLQKEKTQRVPQKQQSLRITAVMFIAAISILSSTVAAKPQPVSPTLLNAIAYVESRFNPRAVGDNGKAVGLYQIHKRYVDDVNRIQKNRKFFYQDRLCPKKSRQMVAIYLAHYGKNLSDIDRARVHNGGPKGHLKAATRAYGQKVNAAMRSERVKRWRGW